MTYSHTKYAGDHPDRFPAPQTWLVWIPDDKMGHQTIPNPDFDSSQPADYKTNREYVHATGVLKPSHVGKVRHKNGIEDAKKYVNGFTRSRIFWEGGTAQYEDYEYRGETKQRFMGWKGGRAVFHKEAVFVTDWRIFEFADGEWVLRHEGKRGDKRAQHPLWEKVGRKQKIKAATSLDEQEAYARKVVEASILRRSA